MTNKILALVLCFFAISLPSYANDTFESIAGIRLGQKCTGPSFVKKQNSLRNPDDVQDEIVVTRNLHESLTSGGHSLTAVCGIINDVVIRVSLSSKKAEDISEMRASLREKMGRAPDDKTSISTKPQRLLGITMDGNKFESEYWNLSENRRASSFTSVTLPFGMRDLSDLKWIGGIELSYTEVGKEEWQYLKDRGIKSSKQKEAIEEKQRKDGIKSLLN